MKRFGSVGRAEPSRRSPHVATATSSSVPGLEPDPGSPPGRFTRPRTNARHQVVQAVLRLVLLADHGVDQAGLDHHVERRVAGAAVAEHGRGDPAAEGVDRQVRHGLDHPAGRLRKAVEHAVEPGPQHAEVVGHVTGEAEPVEPLGDVVEREVRALHGTAPHDPHRERHPGGQAGHLARRLRLGGQPLLAHDLREQGHGVLLPQRAQRHVVGGPQPMQREA